MAHNQTVTIMIVEDEPLVLDLLRKMLGAAGYRILAASNSRHALEIVEGQKIELLISDVVMPGMPGTELAKQLKLLHPGLDFYSEALHAPYSSRKSARSPRISR